MSAMNDIFDDGRLSYNTEEFLAKGQYESNSENILKGFDLFQKKYVYKNIIIELILVVLAIASQVVTILTTQSQDIGMNVMLIIFCVFLGIWLSLRPVNTKKTLKNGIEKLDGTIYEAEITTASIKISTIYDAPVENGETADTETLAETEKTGLEAIEEAKEAVQSREEDDEIPATLIHLDNAGVELLESSDLFVLYVKKINMFVIPKSAFKQYEIDNIKNKLSNIMGVRYISM